MERFIASALYLSSIFIASYGLVAYDCSDTTANITAIAIDKIHACNPMNKNPSFKSVCTSFKGAGNIDCRIYRV